RMRCIYSTNFAQVDQRSVLCVWCWGRIVAPSPLRQDKPNRTYDETRIPGGIMNKSAMPAQAGLEWLWSGLQLWRSRPQAMAVVALTCAVATILPWVGGLLSALVIPLAYGGLIRWLDRSK